MGDKREEKRKRSKMATNFYYTYPAKNYYCYYDYYTVLRLQLLYGKLAADWQKGLR